MPETHQPRIEHALDLLDRELTIVTDERDAFTRFRARIENIDPSNATAASPISGGDAVACVGTTVRPDSGSQRVRAAYEETVLSIPHYADEYGEPARVNFAAELGTEVAVQVFQTGRLTPPVYETILRATGQAIEERTTFLETLQTERRSLCRVRNRLDECESRAAELGAVIDGQTTSTRCEAIDDELATLESICTDLAAERQDLLHGRTTASLVGISGEKLVRYLYEECDAICPALADSTDCIETIRRQRERCLR